MATGFVLIDVAAGFEKPVYETLLETGEIKELHPLFGEHDLIAKIEASGFEELSDIVVKKIRSVEGVEDTKTLTGAKF